MLFESQVVEIELRLALQLAGCGCGPKIQNRKSEIENPKRGCSSVGRAVALQAIGQEFESPQLHQPSPAPSQQPGRRVAQLVRACA